jgi:hypothetical protein
MSASIIKNIMITVSIMNQTGSTASNFWYAGRIRYSKAKDKNTQ